ncbi:PTS system, glucitol/sorbitol-specific IIA component [Clostridium sp. USBA 49]|uniref:PTS glucitol/sorbitol transporter subunit IIA n=1 Tax=Clostridium sp. USBA 49 TaxID=1881060 RepID=UPI0009D5895B|nr:PTS glucitol/sorbitol transporter subunit IIA [Clostridium sp. USBA 49]SKA87718.1 PTS system, glucitol/sorbitol-specific IIA component [Clostridium sp. USBA 49]
MNIIYENKISNVGAYVDKFIAEKIILLFSEESVMTQIKEYSYTIKNKKVNGIIKEGQILKIDNECYKITAVGDIVQKNLEDIAHVTLKFDGSKVANFPGTLYLEDKKITKIHEGTIIQIIEL